MTISRNVSLLAGVTMMLGGVFGFSVEAMAAPAEIFNPLLSDIRQQLPPGTNLRLPAYFPASSLTLYPHIEADERGFRVNITADPNCGVSSCALGSVGILSETEPWPPTADTVESISLSSGLESYYLTWGQGWLKSHTIVWRQDGQTYGVGTLASAVDTEELVAIAESMLREQPINSSM